MQYNIHHVRFLIGSTREKLIFYLDTFTDIKRTTDLICSDVEKAKTEIQSFSPDQCSGYKLIPKLVECQNTCSAVNKYFVFDQAPFTHEEIKAISEKCEAIVNIWKLVRSIRELKIIFFQFIFGSLILLLTEPDKSVLEQACSETTSLGFDIGDSPAAKCEKDSFWKDQKILANICARLQTDYNFLEPETLQQAFKELKSKLDGLKSKWELFKEEKASSRKNFTSNYN